MSKDDEKDSDYRVGYKNPPRFSQYKKGVSGNPGGRPKGTKSMKNLIYTMAGETITAATQDGPKQMLMQEAIARKFWELMLKKGDRQLFQLYMGIEKEVEKELALKAVNQRNQDRMDTLQAMKNAFFRGPSVEISTIQDDEVREYVQALYEDQEADRMENENGIDAETMADIEKLKQKAAKTVAKLKTKPKKD